MITKIVPFYTSYLYNQIRFERLIPRKKRASRVERFDDQSSNTFGEVPNAVQKVSINAGDTLIRINGGEIPFAIIPFWRRR
jgi:hypothetical protein